MRLAADYGVSQPARSAELLVSLRHPGLSVPLRMGWSPRATVDTQATLSPLEYVLSGAVRPTKYANNARLNATWIHEFPPTFREPQSI